MSKNYAKKTSDKKAKYNANSSSRRPSNRSPNTASSRNSELSSGGLYSAGAVTNISPALQGKFVQLMQADDAQGGEPALDGSALEEEATQFKCDVCGAESHDGADEPIQTQNDDEVGHDTVESEDPVQMWSCDDHTKPTCSLQAKEEQAGEPPASEAESEEEPGEEITVQNKCSSCESEEQAVQQKSSSGSKRTKRSRLREASDGLRHVSQPLPHFDKIQSAFGHHDISSIRTETGGSAGRASKNMGALAYASGDRIGFRNNPSLHLTAHEAAHVVQQRSGLKLPGNVGQPGDRWERHADQVADRVAAGKSAESLLDTVAPTTKPSTDSIAPQPAKAGQSLSRPANGDGISGAVQHQITSFAEHQTEEGGDEVVEQADGAGGATEAGAMSAEAEAGGADVPEAEASEQETDPAADCAEAQGDNEPDPAPPEQASGEGEAGAEQGAVGTPEMGRCYNATTSEPPEGTQDPPADAPGNTVEEESNVTYGDWDESNDACECAAADAMSQQADGAGEAEGQSMLSTQVSESSEIQSQSGGGTEGEVSSGEELASSGEASGAQSSGGGAAGGDAGAEAPEASFSQGEAGRDSAVAELDAAMTQVSQVPNRARKLSQGMQFETSSRGSAEESAKQAMQLRQIQLFMQSASGQMDSAVAFVRDEVPARLGGMAETVKANIVGSMSVEKGAISARISQAKNAAIGEAGAARAAISAEHDSNVSIVNSETDAAIQTLYDAYFDATDSVSSREETSLTEVNKRFSDGRTAHENKGTAKANQAIATGQHWVNSYDACRSGPGNDNKPNGDDGFWDGCLTVRRAKAQQDAACKTATGFANNMIDISKKKGFDLREQRTQYRCAVIAGASEAQSVLDTAMERLSSGLESGRSGTLGGLAQARDMNLSAVDGALTASLNSLSKQEREQHKAVNDSGYTQQVAVEQMAHQVAAGLAKSVTSAMESLEQTLSSLREKLLQGDAPEQEQLDQALTSAGEGLGGGVNMLLEKMEEGASSGEMSLMQSGESSASALAEITSSNASMAAESESGFSSQMSTLTGAAATAMTQLSDTQVQKAQESASTGSATMQQVATGFTTATVEIYARCDAVIATSLGELDTELTGMSNKLGGKIAAEAWRAASKEQPAWKGVVAIVLIVLIIIASVVVTVLTAGAAGPVALILIGAIVGGITAGLIQVVNNWASGEEWDKGLVQAIVIGAVGGALGGAIGAGANGLAQAAIQGAAKAGASALTRAAINVSVNLAGDMAAEGASQAFGYFAYGQKFNWQGFVMAGGMSALSTAKGGLSGGPVTVANPGGASAGMRTVASAAGSSMRRAARGAMKMPTRASMRQALALPTGSSVRQAMGNAVDATSLRGLAGDAAAGLGLAATIEGINVAAGGEFDMNRFASTAAGAGSASRASSIGAAANRGGGAPDTAPTRPQVDAPAATPARPTAPDVDAPTTPPRAAPEVDTPSAAPRPNSEVDTPSPAPRVPAEPEISSTPRRPTDADTDSRSTRPSADIDSDGLPTRPQSDTEGTPVRPNADSDVDGGRPRTDADEVRPIKDMSDAEMVEITKTSTKVGDADHETSVRKQGEGKIECDICSRACGPVKNKINEIENELVGNTTQQAKDLSDGLQVVKKNISDAEARIEGREQAGEFQAGKDVIDLARSVADDFRNLGQQHKVLGDAINDPTIVRAGAEPLALSGRVGQDIDVSALKSSNKLEVDSQGNPTTRRFDADDFGNVGGPRGILADGQQCVYVLRGPDGVVLKVGKSSSGNVGQRFRKYKNAGSEVGIDLTLEVTPLKAGMTETDASGVETALRSGLESEGHMMPWDNTGGSSAGQTYRGRLNRPGTGVPFEPIRGKAYIDPDTGKSLRSKTPDYEWNSNASVVRSSGATGSAPAPARPSTDQLHALLQRHNGNIAEVRAALKTNQNIERTSSTIYRWIREAGLDLSSYQN